MYKVTLPSAEAPRRQITPDLVRELDFLSRGFSIEESADASADVGVEGVRSRRRTLRTAFNARTSRQAVAIGIQEGFLPVRVEENPQLESLSPMQGAVLRLAALGWKVEEIAKRRGVSRHTVNSEYQEIRRKTEARNMNHSIRRSFELGIFKIGEPILDPDEQTDIDNNQYRVVVGETVLKLGELGLRNPREIELIRLFRKLDAGIFNRAQMYGFGFYEDAISENARAHAYGRAVVRIAQNLETAFGEPIIERQGVKGFRNYRFKKPVSIGPPDDIHTVPAHTGADAPPAYEKRSRLVQSKKPRATGADRTSLTGLSVLKESGPKQTYEHIDLSELPELTDDFLRTLTSREESETSNNLAMGSIREIMFKNTPLEYGNKVLISLRYGIHLNPHLHPISINRNGSRRALREIMQFVRPYQGLDIFSAASVIGAQPVELLEKEKDFLVSRQKDYPRLRPLINLLDSQIAELKKR